jgi:hypothetical protein
MALVSLAYLATGALRLADLENATNRFPVTEQYDYVNRGIRFVYRELVTVADRPFYIKANNSIVTQNGVSLYPLAADFLRMVNVLWSTSPNGPWRDMEEFEECDRSMLYNSGYFGGMFPRSYTITGASLVSSSGSGAAFTQGTIPTAYSIEILPAPASGISILYRYVPQCPLLVNATDTFDGILGFEEAIMTWAAILMRRKDDLPTDDLERDMERHIQEIRKIARHRTSRPVKIQQVRSRNGRIGRAGRSGRPW